MINIVDDFLDEETYDATYNKLIRNEFQDVKVGDKVIFGGYSNTEIKIAGVEYMLVKNENIFAKIA